MTSLFFDRRNEFERSNYPAPATGISVRNLFKFNYLKFLYAKTITIRGEMWNKNFTMRVRKL